MELESFLYGYVVEEQDYADGQTIIEENSQGDWVYLVIEGKVKAKKNTTKGIVMVETINEGGIFGLIEMFAKTDKIRKLSFIADGHVKIGLLDGARLSNEYERLSPELNSLLRALAKRLSNMTEKVSFIAAGKKTA